jgi:conjugal transfer/type IV secretion protein DotA/TraY
MPIFSKSFKLLKDVDTHQKALDFVDGQNIAIVFGDQDCGYGAYRGHIFPYCGEVSLPTTSLDQPGAKTVQAGYFDLIKHLWGSFDTAYTEDSLCKNATVIAGAGDQTIRTMGAIEAQKMCKNQADSTKFRAIGAVPTDAMTQAVKHYQIGDGKTPDRDKFYAPNGDYKESSKPADLIAANIIRRGQAELEKELKNPKGRYAIPPDQMVRGWVGAGIWYNKIAEMNGALVGAAWNFPTPNRYPFVMHETMAQNRLNNENVSSSNQFMPTSGAEYDRPGDETYATTMADFYDRLSKEVRANVNISSGNPLNDMINFIFGTQGLFDLSSPENQNVHPLAQLVGVGKGLIEASIRNIGLGLMAGGAQIGFSFVEGMKAGGQIAESLGGFFFAVATLTLTAGFILFYVIPFLPFLYFFFAAGNWLKGIFEAMVGVPLWALAHIRIDGNGLPGEAAINGYFMLFEIFLRPILILFGLLAAITIFAAMAAVLHEIFPLVTENLTGVEAEGAQYGRNFVDKLFYTVMYAVIMYIMALSAFKLIDLIPQQLMRWMGSNISTFADLTQDPAQNLTNYTAIAGSQITQNITGGIQQGISGMQKGAEAVAAASKPKP